MRVTLAALVDGLTYASESDRPFEPVMLDDPDPRAPLDAALLARVLGIDAAGSLELRTVDEMLAR
ncbi:MAG: nuclease A inhibitor family protein, partial [Gemmatimonadaceae bacterium]|nr:nuclease A inhibitor family protein [Gemmatimonadaceae bacterium]